MLGVPPWLILGVFLLLTGPLLAQPEPNGDPPSEDESGPMEAEQQFTEPTTPRRALAMFVVAMERQEYSQAAELVDFSQLSPPPNDFQRTRYVIRIHAIINRLPIVSGDQISDEPEGDVYPFPPGASIQPIEVKRQPDGRWMISSDTVASVDELFEDYKDRPLPESPEAPPPPTATEEDEPTETEESTDTDPVIREELKSARRTMRTLMDSLEADDFAVAIATLDYSDNPETGPYVRLLDAQHLKAVIDRMARIDYAEISDDPDGPTFYFPPDAVERPIEIVKTESGEWKFSQLTVSRLDELFDLYRNRPVLNQATSWYERELILENETWRILGLFAAIFGSLAVGQLLRAVFRWRAGVLAKRERRIRSTVLDTLARTVLPIASLVGLHVGTQMLLLEHTVGEFLRTIISVVFALVIGYVLFRLVDVAVELLRKIALRSGSSMNDMLVPIVSTSLRLTIIVLVALEIATALSDKPPSSLIAGLGVSGLALGLAAQDTLKNFFGSLMIFADRPFELGDRIVIDGHDGPVERLGFRSIRIRTLDGHLVTVPNSDVAQKVVCNIGKRPYIRRVMNIRLSYKTPSEMVERAVNIIREVLDNHEGMQEDRPPRVFVDDFLDTAVNVRVFYWYHPPDYWQYCDFGAKVNLEIIKRFDAEGIGFALPSQTLYLDDERQRG